MDIEALTGATTRPNTQSAFSALTSDDFAKIIFAELGRQDPLAPQDTGALIDQIAGIRSIQSNMDLTSNLKTLVGQNEFASASSLIGKRVIGLTPDMQLAAGLVEGVGRTRDGTMLLLQDGARLMLSAVQRVEEPPRTPPPEDGQ